GDDRARRHPRRLARHHDRAPPLARARRGRDRTAPLHGAQQPLLEPGLAPADGVAPRHDLHLRHRALRGLAPPGLGRGPRAPGSRARDQRPRPLPPAQRSGAERLVLDPALTRAHPTAAAADGPLKIAVRDLVVHYGGTRALAVEPEVVLMDEPASALDPIATAKIEELIHELKNAYTIVIVTHNMQQAARVSDLTAYFYLGRLIEFGPTERLFTNPTRPETEDYVTGRFG